MSDLLSAVKTLTKWDTAAWMEMGGKIADDSGNIETPICNEFQREVSDIIKWCHENQRPCRIIILKPRRKGSSTVSVAAGYRRLSAQRATGCIAGGSHYQGKKLFDMLKIYADNDELNPKSCKVMDMDARFTNGSSMDRLTLATAAAGRSGGYQFLVITEMALLSAEGVANAPAVVSGLLKTVKHLPDTIVILESTASGASGDYYERYQAGITFDEFKAGQNGFVKVFYPWFAFSDSRLADPSSEGIRSEDDYTSVEKHLADEHGLDIHQVAWMRMTLRDDCRGNFDKFQEDFPFDETSAFLKSGRSAFGNNALRYQEQVARQVLPEYGMLVYNESADRVSWIPTEENEAMLVRFEPIKVGCRYVLAVDPATGADQTGGEDPDSHGVVAIRDGYVDQNGDWNDPAVVMCNMMVPESKGGALCCWWAVDVLEEQVWRMARYWQAIICPEMNKDSGMVELLKMRGDVEICMRPIFNRRENEFTKAYGWMTDMKTRPAIIEGLSARLRNAGKGMVGSGIEARSPWIVDQMRNFVVNKNGRAEAASGKHDDFVLALSIGCQHLGMASAWRELARDTWVPRDLMMARERRQMSGARTFL